jgi:hypothetical protein
MHRLSPKVQQRVLYIAPVVIVAVIGMAWIAFHVQTGRGQVHSLFQILALAENVIALLLRRRKPVGALAGILVVYLFVDLEPVTGLPLLLALLTVAMVGSRRAVFLCATATTAVVVGMPYLHGDHTTVVAGLLCVAAAGCMVAAGSYLRTHRKSVTSQRHATGSAALPSQLPTASV